MMEQSSEDEFDLTPTAKDILLFSLSMDDEIAPEDLENLGELKWPHQSTQVNTAANSLELDSTIYTPRSRSQLEALSEGSCTGDSPAQSARRSAAATVQVRKQVAAGRDHSVAVTPGGSSSQQLDPTVWYERLHKEKPNSLCKQSYQTCGSAATLGETAAETSKAEEAAATCKAKKKKKQRAAKRAAKEADNNVAAIAEPVEKTRGRPNSKEKTKTGCNTAKISRSRCNTLLEADLNLLHTTLVAESVSQRALNLPQECSIPVANSTPRGSMTSLKQSEREGPSGESEELWDDEEWDEDEGDDAQETELGEARSKTEGDGSEEEEEDQSSTDGDSEDQRASTSAVQSLDELLGTDDDEGSTEGSTDLSALLASSDDDSPSLPLERDLERVSAEVSPAPYVCLSPASRTQNEKTPPQKRGTKWRGALNQIYTDYEYGETDSLLDRAKYDTALVKKGRKSIRAMHDARMEE